MKLIKKVFTAAVLIGLQSMTPSLSWAQFQGSGDALSQEKASRIIRLVSELAAKGDETQLTVTVI